MTRPRKPTPTTMVTKATIMLKVMVTAYVTIKEDIYVLHVPTTMGKQHTIIITIICLKRNC